MPSTMRLIVVGKERDLRQFTWERPSRSHSRIRTAHCSGSCHAEFAKSRNISLREACTRWIQKPIALSTTTWPSRNCLSREKLASGVWCQCM